MAGLSRRQAGAALPSGRRSYTYHASFSAAYQQAADLTDGFTKTTPADLEALIIEAPGNATRLPADHRLYVQGTLGDRDGVREQADLGLTIQGPRGGQAGDKQRMVEQLKAYRGYAPHRSRSAAVQWIRSRAASRWLDENEVDEHPVLIAEALIDHKTPSGDPLGYAGGKKREDRDRLSGVGTAVLWIC